MKNINVKEKIENLKNLHWDNFKKNNEIINFFYK
jgi:hypothetical protein